MLPTSRIRIELELSPEEVEYLSTTCMARVLSSIKLALPNDYEYIEDVEDSMIYERLRQRICNEVFILRQKEMESR
jgi:hypothetical protein